eukprot:12039059-Ditylum_brightwellii.AAC.2
MGVPIDGLCDVYCNNKALMLTAQRLEATIKKKQNAINWHCIWEACMMGMCQVAKEKLETNTANALTKCLATPVRWRLIKQIL